ncbi:hypothetical protein BDU57DRAFT_573072 [Ampelomyces quisqualis]|uniref:F-box domain-containing protein n=1 Tax=Ampelomyces quisqualis TaxID=50730 RepID=A0A6A5QM55_AMPQU|nr:hypothetical protein BDU57DRAFT_573072 [Ampelomyces quisqualis]
MAKLKDLPAELLLLCVSFLGPLDLRQLALASSWVRPAAENALYQSPIIDNWYSSRERYRTAVPRLHAFARTLLHRPDLAKKVHGLSMTTAKHDHESNQFLNLSSDGEAFQLLERIGQESMQWHARVEDWQARLRSGQGHAWAGLILALLPRLTYLSIETLSSVGLQHLNTWDPARYAHNPLEKLFGFIAPSASPECLLPLDLSFIAGLRNLEHLSLNGAELDMAWFQLPDLRSLVLGPHCTRPDILKHCQYGTPTFPHRSLQHISAEISSCLTLDYGGHYTSELDAAFLSSTAFPALESLKLSLVNTKFSHYHGGSWAYGQYETGVLDDVLNDASNGSLDILLDKIEEVGPLLLNIDINFYIDEDASFIAFIEPTISMMQTPQQTNMN